MQYAIAELGQVCDLTRAMFQKRRARGRWQRIARGEQRTHLRLAQRNRGRPIGLSMRQTIRVWFQHTVLSRHGLGRIRRCPKPDRRRALELLASWHDRCTEAMRRSTRSMA
jgi:hypothetical protein